MPGSSKGNTSNSGGQSGAASSVSNSGLAALQSMALSGGNIPGLSAKDSAASVNALFQQAQAADTQAFIKQQQKLLQQLPANSPQRKSYEALLAEIKQAHDYNT